MRAGSACNLTASYATIPCTPSVFSWTHDFTLPIIFDIGSAFGRWLHFRSRYCFDERGYTSSRNQVLKKSLNDSSVGIFCARYAARSASTMTATKCWDSMTTASKHPAASMIFLSVSRCRTPYSLIRSSALSMRFFSPPPAACAAGRCFAAAARRGGGGGGGCFALSPADPSARYRSCCRLLYSSI